MYKQEGAEYTSLGSPCAQCWLGRGAFSYFYHLASAREEVQYPVVETVSVGMSLAGMIVLSAEL